MEGDKGKSRRGSLSVLIGLIVICFASAAAAKDPLTKEERDWSTKHGVV